MLSPVSMTTWMPISRKALMAAALEGRTVSATAMMPTIREFAEPAVSSGVSVQENSRGVLPWPARRSISALILAYSGIWEIARISSI